MKYSIILEKEEGGYSAQCLELPGAISQGKSKEEAIENIKVAIELVLETLVWKPKKGVIPHHTAVTSSVWMEGMPI